MPFVGSYGHDKGEGRDHIRIKEVHKTATKHSRKTHRTRTSDIEKTSHTRRQNVGKVTRHLSSSQFHFTETNKDVQTCLPLPRSLRIQPDIRVKTINM
ncbi:uncharacterized protein LOC5522037 isoform X7 [Nematostella vectensis]|uniref:uncharacterized protein LOC5522037 isoform X7 n=1 Tax=Nematostella vectensis TaxID=45351 RepID=UPI0020776624|nr:uncharacterized protein LOC5522037 isoform X7 [Nematostella vectensis]